MSLFLAEDLMLPLLSPIHATTKKREKLSFLSLVPKALALVWLYVKV